MASTHSPTKSLSEVAQQVAGVFALIYPNRPARTKAMQWLNIARRAITGDRGITSNEMREAVEELVSAGFMLPSVESKRGVAAMGPGAMPGTVTRFCEVICERDMHRPLLNELDSDTYSFHDRYASSRSLPEKNLEQHARIALITDNYQRFAEVDMPYDMLFWLTEPRAGPYLARLPEKQRQSACQFGLSRMVYYMQPFQVFLKTCLEAAPDKASIKLLAARALIFQGDLKQANATLSSLGTTELADKRNAVEWEALQALIATLQGDDEQALKRIDRTLELERSGTRKRIVYADTVPFSMALLALPRAGTPTAMAQFKELMAARKKLKIESDIDRLYLAAEFASTPFTGLGTLYLPGAPSIMSVLYAVATQWHKDYLAERDREAFLHWLQMLIRHAYQSDFHWAVAELLTVAVLVTDGDLSGLDDTSRKLIAEKTPEKRHQALGTCTLTSLVTTLETWEYTLRELEQLSVTTSPKKTHAKPKGDKQRRLVWQVHQLYPGYVELTPMEQSLGKNGLWSGGRRVALKRLLEQSDSMTHLIEQDRKASRTIRKLASYDWGGGGTSYEIDDRTLFQLVGHPQVMDENGDRVEVIEKPPELNLSESGEQIRLTMEPEFHGIRYIADLDQSTNRLYVTRFTAAQQRIGDAIPEGGFTAPLDARDRLNATMAKLSVDIRVQGDAGSVAEEAHSGDPQPLLELEQFGHSLRVRFRVEPLAESRVFFDAGVGGSVVYVQSDSGSASVQRDLQLEQSRLLDLVAGSSVLSTYYDGRPHLVLDHTLDALELLDEVQDSGIRCLWPRAEAFKIKSRVDSANVNLSITSATDWFRASGELLVGEGKSESVSLEQLLESMRSQPGSRFIELGEGQFIALSKRLEQQLRVLQAFTLPATGKQKKDRVHPAAVLALEPLFDAANVKGDKAWSKHRKLLTEILDNEPPLPATLEADLRPYQVEGFTWLARLGQAGFGACLADDMGLGKTIQTLAVLLCRAADGPALVVAPTSVSGNWLQECQRFAPTLNVVVYADSASERRKALDSLKAFDVVIISYGLMLNDIEHLEKVHWRTVVLDEAQAIKNAATGRAKAAKQLVADFKIITTGTPVQNSLMDLHSLFGFLNPYLLGSESAFRKRFATPITQDNDAYAREQLNLLISPFLLRRQKREVLRDLPARTEVTLDVKLSREEALLYETVRKEALESLKKSAEKQNVSQQKIIILSYLTKLRRLCCHPELVVPEWTGPASKLAVFADTIDELIRSGHKTLVFSQFVGQLKIVQRLLEERDIQHQYLDGSTTAKQRTQRVAAFQAGEGDAFLISLTAGGTGLNLTAADYVIHLDPWWNPAVEDQASDRVHRIGQQRPVTIYRMVTTGTIEEQIQDLHRSKRELAQTVLTGSDNSAIDADMMLKLLGQSLEGV